MFFSFESFFFPDTWYLASGICKAGGLATWISGYLDTWIPDTNTQCEAYLDIGIHGYVDT